MWILLLFSFLGLSSCSGLLYYPTTIKYVNEAELKHTPAEIFLKYDEQTELVAWYFEAPKEKRKNFTFVFFHGNGQNISSHFQSLYWILDYGYNFLIFDYLGYGPNPGQPSPENTVESGKIAINWVKTNRPHDAIGIFGQSLGGNVALRTMSELDNFYSCVSVIESSFLSYQNIAQAMMRKRWLTWPFQFLPYLVMSDTKAAATNLSRLTESNYIIIHSKTDAIVPYNFGVEVFEKLPQKKQFWEVDTGYHADAFFRKTELREKLTKEIQKNCLN